MERIKVNRLRIAVAMLVLPTMLWAQGQGVRVALRGGAGQWQSGQAASQWTPEGGLDVNYLVRWRVLANTQLGLATGVGASYASYALNGDFTDRFTRQDYLGNTIDYTTSASVEEKHQSIGVTVPVLFSLQTHGVALNVGPRLQWMAYDRYDQTITKNNIDAFFPAYGVHVHNQPSTGQLATPYTQTMHLMPNTLHVLLSAELGYEWRLGDPYSKASERYVGVQVYANYGLWSWSPGSAEPFMSVSVIQEASSRAKVTTGSIGTSSSPLSYMSAGVRLYYTWQTVDYPARGWHRYRRH